jgi:hypothetical protein
MKNIDTELLDQQVYCTNCYNFRLCDEGLPYCPFEDKCNINKYKQRAPLSERPYFEGMVNKESTK